MQSGRNKYDVIIAGCGIAGLTAAVYLGRASLKTLVFGIPEKSNAYRAKKINNYLGFTKAISGRDLMQRSKKQAEHFGAQFIGREIANIIKKDSIFYARDTENELYEAKNIIICSGLAFKNSGIENEADFVGKGLSYCATCDGLFFKDKKIAVIGNADFAGVEALELTNYTNDITILSHGRKFEFSKKVTEELGNEKIKLFETPFIQKFEGDVKLRRVVFKDGKAFNCDGVFMAFGTAGIIDFAKSLGLELRNNFIVIDPRTGATNVPGVYGAGDCTGGNSQLSKSGGEGCNAAVAIIKSLKGLKAYVDY